MHNSTIFPTGDRAHVIRFDDYVQDYVSFVRKVVGENPDCPYFLIGHSMGGAIACVIRSTLIISL
jgi:alpha-beta hydrolase superfamily lysophospholipase